MPMINPPHPGEIVREECLAPLGLSVADAARALGVAQHALDRLVGEEADLTPEMAVRLEKAFGSSADMWLRLQVAFDLAQVRRREGEIHVRRIETAQAAESASGDT